MSIDSSSARQITEAVLHRNLSSIFEKLFGKQFRFLWIICSVALMASLSRRFTEGWKPVFFLQLSAPVLFFMLSFFSKNRKESELRIKDNRYNTGTGIIHEDDRL